MTKSIEILHAKVCAALQGEGSAMPARTHKLWRDGKMKMAKKLVEEAAEVALDCVQEGSKTAVIQESADLLYHLTLLWVASDISPQEVWDEMTRRDALYGLAEKLAKVDGKSHSQGVENLFERLV
jgi:phosphoribosyl-ATP pyrophosphohydrolase